MKEILNKFYEFFNVLSTIDNNERYRVDFYSHRAKFFAYNFFNSMQKWKSQCR